MSSGIGQAGSAILGPRGGPPAAVAVLSDLVPGPYWVSFYERDQPANRIAAKLGDAPPTPASASGGGLTGDWSIVAMPKRAAVTWWQGRTSGLILMTVPIFLGGPNSGPVNADRNVLSAMYRPADPTQEPPVIRVLATGDAVPYQQLDWVITAIAWGNADGGQDGNRIMQALTVSLLEHRDDEVIQTAAAAAPKHRAKTYTVKTGDTLKSIAKRFNVKGGWTALAAAQTPPIQDPRQIRVGQRLLIP